MPAISGEAGFAMSRAELQVAVETLGRQLRGLGVKSSDRVAIVVRNGPVAAISFLSVATAAVAAPLNPAYKKDEFVFALGDLPATVLLTDGSIPAAREAGEELGIRTFELTESGVLAGIEPLGEQPQPKPSDVALVLHTSGTTGQPKRVPLTHHNLTASARNIAEVLELSPSDRCLNVMPLFHIHGLVAGVLASLTAGGSVVCTPGFDAFRMFAWLESFRPSWYTAVPTMHQAIVLRSQGRGLGAGAKGLRFVRSSSSALPPAVLADVERLFGVPVVEAYGMTEASHQIASNPLQRESRRPGTVGLPAGVEVAVFSPDGVRQPSGTRGEVAIRGDSVTSGYEGIDPYAYLVGDGWLRTGDEGVVEQDGFLRLTGRLKEMINRGGEKVSPREVEDVLLTHPSVLEAVVFAIPHEMLGEDIGAAVRLREPGPGAASELRAFVAMHVSAFKVPRKIVVLDQIPLGPTGKPQRIGMAGRLGLG
ncbi:MAG: AMP-binding protein [bacterium]